MNIEVRVGSCLLNDVNIRKDNVCVEIFGDIDVDLSKAFCSKLLELDKMHLEYIPIHINSEGGCVDQLIMIMQTMEMCVTPLMTIVTGAACSAAAVIFAMGSENLRFMCPNSYLMFHEASFGTNGKSSDVAASASNVIKIDKKINKKLEKHIGLDTGFFEQQVSDFYLDAKDALKYNICTGIGYPVVKFEATLTMTYELKSCKRQCIEDTEKRHTKFQRVYAPSLQEDWV